MQKISANSENSNILTHLRNKTVEKKRKNEKNSD